MSEIIHGLTTHGVEHVTAGPAVAIDHVWLGYAPTAESRGFALQDVTFTVAEGEHVAVVGPNGAGKSTLFKVIVGTVRPDRGEVRIYGHAPEKHLCVAYIPQRNQLDWKFPVTVEDVVMMGRVRQVGLFRRPGKADWESVHRSLGKLRLEPLARRQIGELSGGQQQRVFIARALAQEADLLLLDEPFSGLDAPSHEATLETLDSLRGEPVTVMLATHDLDLAAERFDRIMLLNRRLIAIGPPATALAAENLLAAYGAHAHYVEAEDGRVQVTDSCCDEGEEVAAPPWSSAGAGRPVRRR